MESGDSELTSGPCTCDGNSREEKDLEDEIESETGRWNYIKGEVKKMKLLMEKCPKFVKREGSAKIIFQLDSMFNAIESCDNPCPMDLEKIETQLQEFKDTLLEGFGQDLEKWKSQIRYSIHNVMKTISLVLLFIASLLLAWYTYDVLR